MTLGSLITLVEHNQLLSAGLGTTAFGAGLYAIKEAPHKIKRWAQTAVSTVLTVTTKNHEFEDVGRLLAHIRIPYLNRHFIPSRSDGGGMAPGYGFGIARFENTFVVFEREMLDNKGIEIQEKITVRFFTRESAIVSRFLKSAAELQVDDKLKVYVSASDWYVAVPAKNKRSAETVFTAPGVKDKLLERFRWFIDNEPWYRSRGIPYKLCGLLYGPPGTGKTSLAHVVASEFNLRINYVTSLEHVDALIRHCTPRDLVVIEDIDVLADELNRRSADAPAPVAGGDGGPVKISMKANEGNPILHRLLNALDGFSTPHGLKVLISTNHKDRLDEALLRHGRMDLVLEVGPLEQDEIVRMFAVFFAGAPEVDELKDILENEPGIRLQAQTGAYLQDVFGRSSAFDAMSLLISRAIHEDVNA